MALDFSCSFRLSLKFYHLIDKFNTKKYLLFFTDLHYIGCFKDSDPRDLPQRVHGPDLDARTCVHKCKELEFKYAGLQFSYLCFCGNNYGRYGELPQDKCSSKCTSKRDSFCGGHWSNSVYKTGECRQLLVNSFGWGAKLNAPIWLALSCLSCTVRGYNPPQNCWDTYAENPQIRALYLHPLQSCLLSAPFTSRITPDFFNISTSKTPDHRASCLPRQVASCADVLWALRTSAHRQFPRARVFRSSVSLNSLTV